MKTEAERLALLDHAHKLLTRANEILDEIYIKCKAKQAANEQSNS